MPALTPEQEALKQATETYLGNPNPATAAEFKRAAKAPLILAILAQLESYITEYEKVANRLAQLEAVQADTDKLLSIIACAYQIAGWHDAPAHILDVLADPEQATAEQVEAMLPYQPGLVQAVPDSRYDELIYAVARKFPGETRHETALRYIWQAEANAYSGGPAAVGAAPGETGQ